MNKPEYVYELIDSTDDERYYPLGIFSTFKRAQNHAITGDHPPSDFAEEHCRLQVIRHFVDQPSKPAITAGTFEWYERLDEKSDEFVWVFEW